MVRPAQCAVCGQFDESLEWVRFAEYDPDWFRRYPGGAVPPGEEAPGEDCFCPRHVAQARVLAHVTRGEAVFRLARLEHSGPTRSPAAEPAVEDALAFLLGADGEAPTLASAVRTILVNLARELAVLREMLESRGLWDEAEYRRLRIERTIADQGGPGPAPWRRHALYPHVLGDERFLREILGCDDEQVTEFRWAAEDQRQLT